jgi:hypothetical protein
VIGLREESQTKTSEGTRIFTQFVHIFIIFFLSSHICDSNSG